MHEFYIFCSKVNCLVYTSTAVYKVYSSMTSIMEYQFRLYKIEMNFALKLPGLRSLIFFWMRRWQKWLNSDFQDYFYYVTNCLDFSENECLLVDLLLVMTWAHICWYFNFWAPLFCKNVPNFCQVVTSPFLPHHK